MDYYRILLEPPKTKGTVAALNKITRQIQRQTAQPNSRLLLPSLSYTQCQSIFSLAKEKGLQTQCSLKDIKSLIDENAYDTSLNVVISRKVKLLKPHALFITKREQLAPGITIATRGIEMTEKAAAICSIAIACLCSWVIFSYVSPKVTIGVGIPIIISLISLFLFASVFYKVATHRHWKIRINNHTAVLKEQLSLNVKQRRFVIRQRNNTDITLVQPILSKSKSYLPQESFKVRAIPREDDKHVSKALVFTIPDRGIEAKIESAEHFSITLFEHGTYQAQAMLICLHMGLYIND